MQIGKAQPVVHVNWFYDVIKLHFLFGTVVATPNTIYCQMELSKCHLRQSINEHRKLIKIFVVFLSLRDMSQVWKINPAKMVSNEFLCHFWPWIDQATHSQNFYSFLLIKIGQC